MKKLGQMGTAGSVCVWGAGGAGEGVWGEAQGRSWGEMSEDEGKLNSVTYPFFPILLKQGPVPAQPPSPASQWGICPPSTVKAATDFQTM